MSVQYTYNIKVRYKGDNYYYRYVKVCKVFERTKMYKQLMSLFNEDIVDTFHYGVGDDVVKNPKLLRKFVLYMGEQSKPTNYGKCYWCGQPNYKEGMCHTQTCDMYR